MQSHSAKILILEEELAVRADLAAQLHRTGAPLVIAGSVSAALDQITREPVGAAFFGLIKPEGAVDATRRTLAAQSGLPLILAAPAPSVRAAVDAMRAGATDFLIRPYDAGGLAARLLELAGRQSNDVDGPVAEDPASREIFDLARRVAASDATVLLCGESGVGKEVVARYIHDCSPRAKGPFIAVNCAAIPENMLEAMLFGHERGAFTGAHEARAGKFELAQGGTLLLDEVSEMAPALQAKLLRVLQEREVERLGGRRVIPLDVRVLATTNRDLAGAVADGLFREDLYYRLNVFPITIPPLRERPDDILPLAARLLARHCRGIELPVIDPSAEARLLDHPWPGNIRELDNAIQRALILREGTHIRSEDLRFAIGRPAMPAETAGRRESVVGELEDLRGDLSRHEERLIIDALHAGKGSRKAAAERLGISPRTLRYKLARLREAGIGIPG